MKTRFSAFTILKVAFLLIVVVATLFPFIYMISISLSDNVYVLRNEVFLYPKGFTLFMYKHVLSDPTIYTAYLNTILYVITGTALSLVITAAGAYAASRDGMMFRKLFLKLIIICTFFSGGMIPTFLVVMKVGILDTLWGVIVPGAVSTWLFLIMLSYFKSVPKELEDSGKMDGVSDIGIFWYIALPVSKAAMATIGLFYAVGIWNDFLGPVLYLNDARRFPLTVILRNMVVIATSDMADSARVDATGKALNPTSLKYATLVASALPIICVYPFLQKHFVKGVMIGSIKG